MNQRHTHYRVSDHVYAQDVLDETVLMDTHGGHYFELNPSAADIFRLLQKHGDVQRLLAELQQAYDAEPQALARDVYLLLDDLEQQGLIIPVAPVS